MMNTNPRITKQDSRKRHRIPLGFRNTPSNFIQGERRKFGTILGETNSNLLVLAKSAAVMTVGMISSNVGEPVATSRRRHRVSRCGSSPWLTAKAASSRPDSSQATSASPASAAVHRRHVRNSDDLRARGFGMRAPPPVRVTRPMGAF
jgi:hypothetical protein